MMGWESVPLSSEVGSMKAEGEEAKKTLKKDPSKIRRLPPQKPVRKLQQLYSDASLMLTPFESMSLADVKVHLDLLKRERLVHFFNPLLVKLMSHPKNGGTFNTPLDWRTEALNLPDYTKVIETPMDFATIKARVLQGFYPSKRNFVNDIRLVFNNAKQYNPPNHPVHRNACDLLAELEKDLHKMKAVIEANSNQQEKHHCDHCMGRTCALCAEKCRTTDPPILQCFGRSCGQKIKQGTVFYTTPDGLRTWCFKCYATLGAILPSDESVPDEREKEEEEKKLEEKRKREERKLSNDHYTPSVRKPRDKSVESAPTSPRSPEPLDNEDNSDENSIASRDQQAATSAPPPVQYKTDLMKRTLYEDTEKWVQCDSCGRWLHEVCGLFQNATQHANPNVKREASEGYIYPALREVYLEFLKTLNAGDQLRYRCPLCRSHDVKNVDGNSFKFLPRRVKMTSDYPEASKTGHFFRASSLPETPTAAFLEFCLRRRLEQLAAEQLSSGVGVDLETQGDVGEVFVRMVACSEHSWSPDPQLKEVFCDVPDQLNYKSKTFMVFQTRNGIDICLLCLYVQEYGPNQGSSSKRVYISYLDSVDYFRPRHARRGIYYEMLVAYFAWLRLRGFTAVHIWACPPKRGCGYVFWQRPPHQKTPYRGRLVQWYKDMCQRALEVGCCVGVGSFFTDSFQAYLGEKSHKAAAIVRDDSKLEPMPPAFEGDYWLTKANNLCRLRTWRLMQLAARPRPTVKDAMETILKKLRKHGSARVFNKPVDAEALNIPHYRQIIKKPMDFSTCRDKLAEGMYASPKEMADDIRLVFDNATKFNPPGHWINKAAHLLRDYFEKEAREVLLAQSHVKVRLRSGEHLDPFTSDLRWDDIAVDPEWENLALDDLDVLSSPSLLRILSEDLKLQTPKRENGLSPRVGARSGLSPRALCDGTNNISNNAANGRNGSKGPKTPVAAALSPPSVKLEPLSSSMPPLPTISIPNANDLSTLASLSSTSIAPNSSSISPSTTPCSLSLSSSSSSSSSSSTCSSSSSSTCSSSSLSSSSLSTCSSSSTTVLSVSGTSVFPSSASPSSSSFASVPEPTTPAISSPSVPFSSASASQLVPSKTPTRTTHSSQPSNLQPSQLPSDSIPTVPAPAPPPCTELHAWPPMHTCGRQQARPHVSDTPMSILPPPPAPPPPPLPLTHGKLSDKGSTAQSPSLTSQTSASKRRRLMASHGSRGRMAPMPSPIWPIMDPSMSPLYPQTLTAETAEQLHQYHQFQQYYRPHLQQQHYQQLQEFQELQQHQHHQQMQHLQQQQHDAAALHAFQQSQNPNFDSWPPWGALSSFPTHPSTQNALAMALSSFPESTFSNFPSLSPSSASFLLQALSPPISSLALNSSNAASEMFANLIKSLPSSSSGTSAAPATPLAQDSFSIPIPSLDRPLDYGYSYPSHSHSSHSSHSHSSHTPQSHAPHTSQSHIPQPQSHTQSQSHTSQTHTPQPHTSQQPPPQWRPDASSSLPDAAPPSSTPTPEQPSPSPSPSPAPIEIPPVPSAATSTPDPAPVDLPSPPAKRTRKVGRAKKTLVKPPVTQALVVIPKREAAKRESKATPIKSQPTTPPVKSTPVKTPAKATPAKTPPVKATPLKQAKTPKPKTPVPAPTPSPSPIRPSRKHPAPPLPPPAASANNWRKANIPQVPRLLAADMKRSIDEFFVLYLQDESFAKVTAKTEAEPEPSLNSSHKSVGKRKTPGPKPTTKKDLEVKLADPENPSQNAVDFMAYVQPYLKTTKLEPDCIPEDPFIFQPMFESRHAFMQTCQLRRWHFDTLRHAKHASSSILFHLNTSDACDATRLICRKCNSNIEGTVRWHIQAMYGPPLTADEKDFKSSRSTPKTRARTCNIPETEEGELCSACYATLDPAEAELFTPFRMY